MFHPDDEFTAGELGELIGTDRDGIKRLVNAGELPPPIRISKRIFRWRWAAVESQIYRLLQEA